MTRIPRCMSTQHPDSTKMSSFISGSVIGGEDKILEVALISKFLG